MLQSPNLNIIIKSLEKISARQARDFMELENLQSNNFSAIKFANSCYQRIEKSLFEDLSKMRPDYNFYPLGSKKIIRNPNSNYCYLIAAVDGLINLSRSIPSFVTFVALEHLNMNKEKEIIALAILNVASNEIYFCEKDSGSMVNRRKIRVSKREIKDGIICSLSNLKLYGNQFVSNLMKKNVIFKINNCFSIDICQLATGKIDLCIFSKEDYDMLYPLILLAKEAGAKIIDRDNLLLISNGKISFD